MDHAAPSSRMPILMSAVVYPGVGQFMQKRHAVGWMYVLCFSVVAILFFAVLIRDAFTVLTALRHAIETATAPEQDVMDWKPLLKLGGVLLVIYVANVYDAWLAYHRTRTQPIAT